MKINKIVLVIITCLLQVPFVYAAEAKLGFVDAARLLEEAPQANAASSSLKQEFAAREKDMANAQKEVKDMEDKLDRDGAIMSEAEQKKLEADILSRKRELSRKQDEMKEDFNIRRNDEIGKLQKLIKQAIEQVGREGKYDLIFYEGISFANPHLDITDEVLQRLGAVPKNGTGAATKDILEKPPQ